MKPYMKNDEIKLFNKYLSKSTNYFEFGSGGSTLYAIQNNVNNIITVETDPKWIDILKKNKYISKKINDKKLEILYIDINCTWWHHVSWGKRKKPYTKNTENWIKYSKLIMKSSFTPDLILIDGRFRVASALESVKVMNDETYLLFHDYTMRTQYHVIEEFFNKIECVNTLQVFKKKNNISIDNLNNIIEKYRLIID